MPELIGPGKLSGSESIILHGAALSDVISNTARALLAGFCVACDLGVTDAYCMGAI